MMRSARSWIAGLVVGVGVMGGAAAAAQTFDVRHPASIQAAIELAQDGDVIEVGPGTYHEAIDFLGKGITVQSTEGPEVTTIHATGLETSVVIIRDVGMKVTRLEGLTIRGGSGILAPGGTQGGGIYIENGGPTIAKCIIEDNYASAGGGISVRFAWPTIEHTVFRNNGASGGSVYGGGGLRGFASILTVLSCEFYDNHGMGGSWGGGALSSNGTASFVNCRFVSNRGSYGGAIASSGTTLSVYNCNFVDNMAFSSGGAVMIEDYVASPPRISNSVFWGNEGGSNGQMMFVLNNPHTVVEFSALDFNWTGEGAETNILMDEDEGDHPGFMDPDDNNYSLRYDSILRDQGESSAFPESIGTDALGNPRKVGQIDIGAIEYQLSADFNDDGWVDHSDLFPLLGAWGEFRSAEDEQYDLNEDGWVDAGDLAILLGAWGPVSGQDQME